MYYIKFIDEDFTSENDISIYCKYTYMIASKEDIQIL